MTDDSLVVQLHKDDSFILTGEKFKVGNATCVQGDTILCVLIIESTTDQEIAIQGLVRKNNWVGISPLPAMLLLDRKKPDFFDQPNCRGTQCKGAHVYYLRDLRKISDWPVGR